MQVGYARTSTMDQAAGFEAQLAELAKAGCEKVFSEQVSSVARRAQLEAALDFIRDGDTMVVCKLDRLARRQRQAMQTQRHARNPGSARVHRTVRVDRR